MAENKIPVELREAICNGRLIVFVGAGLSYNLTNIKDQPIKGWKNLVEQILRHLDSKDYKVSHLLPLLDIYDPIIVLSLMEKDKNIPYLEINKFIKDFLDLSNANNFELHKKIFSLSKKIITTNYDTAFEIAVPQLRKNKAYKGKNYELTRHKDLNAALLFKLHGCFEEADSMVLYPTNYDDLYKNPADDAEHSLLVLKNIIHNNSILFIGTGMGDFQINNLFQEVKKLQGQYNQKHFIITNKALDSSLDFLTALSIKEHSEIEMIIDELNSVKETDTNKESDEVVHLREQLEAAEMKISTLESKLNASESDESSINKKVQEIILEKEALEYFSKGVELHLEEDLEEAIKQYKIAIDIKPDLHAVFYNWGTALSVLAETKTGKASEGLYEECFDKFQKAVEIKPDDHEAFYNWGTALSALAQIKTGKASEDLYEECFDKYQKAVEIKSDDHAAFYNWGNDLSALAQIKTGKASEDLYEECFDKYQKTVEIKPDDHEAFYNWGTALSALAETKTGKASEDLYEECFDKYQKAVEIKPDDHEAFYNWGTALSALSETKTGKASEDLYEECFDKYQKAVEIKPDYHAAFYNWGTALSVLAKTKTGKASEDLYEECFDKYQKAVEIKPDLYEALNNWGAALLALAKTKTGKASEDLYEGCFDKYQKAVEIKPDYHEVFYNWGAALLDLAKTKTGKASEDLYELSFDKLKKGVENGGESYNLSCAYALCSKKKEALQYLTISLENNEVSAKFVEDDDDWKAYENDKDFISLIQKYKK